MYWLRKFYIIISIDCVKDINDATYLKFTPQNYQVLTKVIDDKITYYYSDNKALISKKNKVYFIRYNKKYISGRKLFHTENCTICWR